MAIDTYAYDQAIRRRNRQLFEEIRQQFAAEAGETYDRPALPGGAADNEGYIAWLRIELQRAALGGQC